jgi:hypothetical protein
MDEPRYNNKFKKLLFEKINSLTTTEHEEIYRIITSSDVNTSKNKNGIFFNLSSIPDDVIERIDTFVNYCISNKQELDDYDKRLNECKLNNRYSDIVNMNIKLEQLSELEKRSKPKDDWSKVKLDPKSTVKFTVLVDKMQEDRDKLHMKKLNSKFVNAKKKYSKRIVNEKKFDSENVEEMIQETYLLFTRKSPTEHTI